MGEGGKRYERVLWPDVKTETRLTSLFYTLPGVKTKGLISLFYPLPSVKSKTGLVSLFCPLPGVKSKTGLVSLSVTRCEV